MPFILKKQGVDKAVRGREDEGGSKTKKKAKKTKKKMRPWGIDVSALGGGASVVMLV